MLCVSCVYDEMLHQELESLYDYLESGYILEEQGEVDLSIDGLHNEIRNSSSRCLYKPCTSLQCVGQWACFDVKDVKEIFPHQRAIALLI